MEAEICYFGTGNVLLRVKWKRVKRQWTVLLLEAMSCVSAKFELHAPGHEDMVSVVQLLRHQGFSLTVLYCEAAGAE
jgi:hypothetical protein